MGYGVWIWLVFMQAVAIGAFLHALINKSDKSLRSEITALRARVEALEKQLPPKAPG